MVPTPGKLAIILGLLSLLGPFSIDMYLPAFPAIAEDLHATTAQVQSTLMAFFLAYGASQIFYGPAADIFGRRGPMLAGLGVYTLASIGCLLAPNIETLIVFRFVQGCGVAAVMVIPRAVIRDLYSGAQATQLMAMVMLVISVSPMLAPLAGSAIIEPFGWKAVFVAGALVAGLGTVLILSVLPETHAPERRSERAMGPLLSNYLTLLKDPLYLGLIVIGGAGIASFFSFLSSASFLYIEEYGLSPTQFALAFAFNAIGFFAMSQLASRLAGRFGMVRLVGMAVAGYAAGLGLLLLLTLVGIDSFFVLVGLLFVSFSFLGLVMPTTMVLALENNGRMAGSASALGGTLQMLMGAGAMGLSAAFFDQTTRPMVIGMTLCAGLAFVVSRLVLPHIEEPGTAPAPQPAAE